MQNSKFNPPAGGFVRACPEFNSGMTARGMILSASWRIKVKSFCSNFEF